MGASARAVGWLSLGWALACSGLPLPAEEAEGDGAGGAAEEAPPSEPEPAEEAPPAEEPPAPAAEPEPEPEPEPAAEPAPGPSEGRGHVSVEGLDRLTLVAEDGEKYAVPADVPLGKYKMKARFGEGQPVEVGTVTVTAAGATIQCKATLRLCRASSP